MRSIFTSISTSTSDFYYEKFTSTSDFSQVVDTVKYPPSYTHEKKRSFSGFTGVWGSCIGFGAGISGLPVSGSVHLAGVGPLSACRHWEFRLWYP
jgi:hypothetical protein